MNRSLNSSEPHYLIPVSDTYCTSSQSIVTTLGGGYCPHFLFFFIFIFFLRAMALFIHSTEYWLNTCVLGTVRATGGTSSAVDQVTVLVTVQSLSHVQLFRTAWTAAHQASLSITNSRSLLKLMSIESVMPSHHLVLCWPLLLPPLIFPSIRVFSDESVLHIRWPKYWSFSFSIRPYNEYSWFALGWTGWISL